MIGLLGSLLGSQGGRMLGGMVGGRTGAMIGGMAGAMLGGRKLGSALGSGKSGLGSLLNRGGDGDSEADGDQMTEADAEFLVRAMANSAKADGHVDSSEIDQILGELGEDVTSKEQAFLSSELSSPFIPAEDIAKMVPDGLAVDAYVVSLLSIEVDNGKEIDYLRTLATAMGIDENSRNAIHDELGVDQI